MLKVKKFFIVSAFGKLKSFQEKVPRQSSWRGRKEQSIRLLIHYILTCWNFMQIHRMFLCTVWTLKLQIVVPGVVAHGALALTLSPQQFRHGWPFEFAFSWRKLSAHFCNMVVICNYRIYNNLKLRYLVPLLDAQLTTWLFQWTWKGISIGIWQSILVYNLLNLTPSTVPSKSMCTSRVFPLNLIVSNSCKIECCGNKIHELNVNMILNWVLELKLSLVWRTTI